MLLSWHPLPTWRASPRFYLENGSRMTWFPRIKKGDFSERAFATAQTRGAILILPNIRLIKPTVMANYPTSGWPPWPEQRALLLLLLCTWCNGGFGGGSSSYCLENARSHLKYLLLLLVSLSGLLVPMDPLSALGKSKRRGNEQVCSF